MSSGTVVEVTGGDVNRQWVEAGGLCLRHVRTTNTSAPHSEPSSTGHSNSYDMVSTAAVLETGQDVSHIAQLAPCVPQGCAAWPLHPSQNRSNREEYGAAV
jgi:hypothetical protein